MVFLHDIVDKLNEVIKGRLSKFARAEFYGIATQAVKPVNGTTVVFPSVISLDGLSKTIEFNNNPPFILYHRAYNSTFNFAAQRKRYGDGPTELVNQECSTVMKIVCTGNRRDIAIIPEEFAMVIADCLPTNAKVEGATKFLSININNIQYDSRVVFNGEFERLAYFIGADRFLFSIQYTIAGGYIKGCLNTCDC
jgi:hypothetical protein